jgi:GNAT superfamily N-acetyltransferase
VAYDGDRPIAHFTSMYGHFVEPEYRGRGIGTQLVFEWFRHNPAWRPTHRATRSAAGQASYRKVWRMLTENGGG